jgi:hypothetical protein
MLRAFVAKSAPYDDTTMPSRMTGSHKSQRYMEEGGEKRITLDS